MTREFAENEDVLCVEFGVTPKHTPHNDEDTHTYAHKSWNVQAASLKFDDFKLLRLVSS